MRITRTTRLALITSALAVSMAFCVSCSKTKPPPVESASSGEGASVAPTASDDVVVATTTLPMTNADVMRPPVVGEAMNVISGCIKDGEAAPEKATRGIAEAQNAAGSEVTVSAMGTGIVINHVLQHTCCLEGVVSVEAGADALRVLATLSGEACRCICSSSLQTAVGLAPGSYELEMVVDDRGTVKTVHTETVTVAGSLRDGAADAGAEERMKGRVAPGGK